MPNEKYIVDIGEQGSEGLDRLDYSFNPTTQAFLLEAGNLKKANVVLDIGCGSGIMTCWLAKQLPNGGKVVAIENDNNQLNAAKRNAAKQGITNIEFIFCSAYDIETLKQSFDLIYCRFVLHHLNDPMTVVKKIYQVLKPNGIYVAEEGIVNFSFSYPFSKAWGDESIRVPPVWVDAPQDQRDGNIGVKMFTKMHRTGFQMITSRIIHPLLSTREEKKLLLIGMNEMKRYYLGEGHTEEEWIALGKETEKIVDNDEQIIGFYGSCQVAGKK